MKYEKNDIIRGIKLHSSQNRGICSRAIKSSSKDMREFLKSITFVNGKAASWNYKITNNKKNICDANSQFNFVCGHRDNSMKKDYVCKRLGLDGNKFTCIKKANEECDTFICDNL